MYLAKKMTSRSLPEIGRRFGGRDHSTVLHAVRKIEEQIKTDDRLARERAGEQRAEAQVLALGRGLGVLLAEALDATSGVDELLLPGEEWVRSGADINHDQRIRLSVNHTGPFGSDG